MRLLALGLLGLPRIRPIFATVFGTLFHMAFQPMPLSRRPAPFDHPEWVFELKYDGFRSLAVIQNGTHLPQWSSVQLVRFSSQGTDCAGSGNLRGTGHFPRQKWSYSGPKLTLVVSHRQF